MAKIKVGIVEDDVLIAQSIINALTALGYDTTESALSYTEALAMIAREQPDILLIDIQLSGSKDGIELAAKVKADHNIPFIFLTANSDAATVERAKKVQPPAYLVKPFNKDELYTSIEICLHNFAAAGKEKPAMTPDEYRIKDYLFIKQGQIFQKVKTEDILYIESDNVYLYLYTPQRKWLVRSTIQQQLDLIGAPHFFRVHRSFAVNAHHIDTINSESLFINGVEIPLGKTYRDELMAFLGLG